MTNKTMKAAFVKAPFQIEVREIAVPDVKDDWALIKVEACGICGTDMHIAQLSDHKLTAFKATDWQGFGHEVAGVVEKVGAGVTHVKEGDKVVLESSSVNPFSAHARNGRADLDNKAPNFWNNDSMGFADYILAPKEAIVPFDGLSFEVASLAEPLGVALDMVYTATPELGNEVLVMGLGAIGLMSIPIVKMQGASYVYAVNRSGGKRFELARAYGADEVISTHDTPLEEIAFRKGGIDRALVSAPPSLLPDVFNLMNYGGIVSYIGIEYGDGATVSFNANDFHFNKTQLRASHASPALYFPIALQLLQDKAVDGEAIISHVMPLEQIKDAMELMRDDRENVLKIVITP